MGSTGSLSFFLLSYSIRSHSTATSGTIGPATDVDAGHVDVTVADGPRGQMVTDGRCSRAVTEYPYKVRSCVTPPYQRQRPSRPSSDCWSGEKVTRVDAHSVSTGPRSP